MEIVELRNKITEIKNSTGFTIRFDTREKRIVTGKQKQRQPCVLHVTFGEKGVCACKIDALFAF